MSYPSSLGWIDICWPPVIERLGAIKIKTSFEPGRAVKTPIVEYEQVEFDLKAA
jgi:hypothetical protein